MRSPAVGPRSLIKDVQGADGLISEGGWVSADTATDAPIQYRNTTQDELQEKLNREGRVGASLKTYILASQASRVLNGSFLDQGPTFSRLLGSRFVAQVISADFSGSRRESPIVETLFFRYDVVR